MKSAHRQLVLRLGSEEIPVTITIEVQDDTARFTDGGKRALDSMRLPITVRWELVTLKFNNAEQVRRAFMVGGQFFGIHPDVRGVVDELLDEIGIPHIRPY